MEAGHPSSAAEDVSSVANDFSADVLHKACFTPYHAFLWYFLRNYDNMSDEKLRKMWKYYIGTELNHYDDPDQECHSLHNYAFAFTKKALDADTPKRMHKEVTILFLDQLCKSMYKNQNQPRWTHEELVAKDWADDPDMDLDYYEWGISIIFRKNGSLKQRID